MPPSSACKGCPNLGERHFRKLKRDDPEYYNKMLQLEVRAVETNPDNPPTLLSKGSLTDLIENDGNLNNWFGEDKNWSDQQCDGGYCFT